MKKQLLIFLWIFSLLVFSGLSSFAQNAPITTATTVGNAVPGAVDVPITVTGFTSIGAVSLSIDYDYSVLHFTGSTPNPLMSNFPIGDLNLGTGFHRLTMGWFGSAVTLSDGSAIMTLHFTYIDGNGTLQWYDSGPSCEYTDENYNVLNDIPTSTYYINGFVCGMIGNPGTITGISEVCAGTTGVEYSIAPVVNAAGYVWAVPEGSVIVTGQNTNAITVDFMPNGVSGNISVYGYNECGNGPVSELPVTVNALPVADAGQDFPIPYGTSTTLSAAAGGPGTYAYHWSPEALLVNPDVQNPQTIILTSTTIFTLLVTDVGASCQSSDQVTVLVTGGPLNVNPVALPNAICQGESAQLYANAGGGSGNYSYEWTSDPPGSPPWSSNLANPFITPDSSLHYLLTVNDGFTTTNGQTSISVFDVPTATISGGDTLCGTDDFTNLRVDLTGTPPWSFTYSYGSTSVFVNGQQETPYFIIASDPGDYTITVLSDEHCEGLSYGTAIVRKYPIPSKPEITVYFQELISSSCCGNQWYKNDTIIPGATGQTYEVLVSAIYHVIVTLNGCSSEPSDTVDVIVGIEEHSGKTLSLSSSPNPFTDFTSISYTLSFEGKVTLEIRNMLGSNFATLVSETQAAGNYTVNFDANRMPAGVYTTSLTLKSRNDELVRTIRIVKSW